MVCYHPLDIYVSATQFTKEGKPKRTFKKKGSYVDIPPEKVPCGQCIGCRLERSRQWAIRCVHEASLFDYNCFITLTYSPEHLPIDGSLDHDHFKNFMKRLRKAYSGFKMVEHKGKQLYPIRDYHCGEYGENFGRPHHHAILFNFDFLDKQILFKRGGFPCYVSKSLDDLWGYGQCVIAEVNFETAAYVARYVTKKITGKEADEHYKGKKPEYNTMSRAWGIGKKWLEKYQTDVYPQDYVLIKGKKIKPPKYYDRIFELTKPEEYGKLRNKRKKQAKNHLENNTPERLLVREEVQELKAKKLIRGYEVS